MLTLKYKSSLFAICLAAVVGMGIFSACGQDEIQDDEIQDEISEPIDSASTLAQTGPGEKSEEDKNLSAETETKETSPEESDRKSSEAEASSEEPQMSEYPELAAMFGDNCITSQTFEVTMSEYDGKVWFVSHYPSKDEDTPFIEIIQNGEVLSRIKNPYVPESLSGQRFRSLDAVSISDVNFDGNTDIILIETYGNTTFAAIYYGNIDYFYSDTCYVWFYEQEDLSENATANAETLTASGVCDYITGGKKNGQFENYQDAYQTLARIKELETSGDPDYNLKYDLIYVDDDEIPELVSGHPGYSVSLYTYRDGVLYTLMEKWGYGAFGVSAYEYAPRKNSLRNYDADHAGAVMYTTYMTISEDSSLEIVVTIKSCHFNDIDGDGYPDGEELESEESYDVTDYISVDGEYVLISEEEYAAYDLGDYEFFVGEMSYDELRTALAH